MPITAARPLHQSLPPRPGDEEHPHQEHHHQQPEPEGVEPRVAGEGLCQGVEELLQAHVLGAVVQARRMTLIVPVTIKI